MTKFLLLCRGCGGSGIGGIVVVEVVRWFCIHCDDGIMMVKIIMAAEGLGMEVGGSGQLHHTAYT